MNIQQGLAKVIERQNLTTEEMVAVMNQIMGGEATPAQIGGFLVGLRMKGETIDEITGAATVMRELASGVKVDDANAVDTCGTGGDGSNLFNVSTASSFVVAASGGKVAKHGNRSASSRSGAADVLGRAGPGGLQQPWIGHAWGGLVDPLDPDTVVPVIAEVVDILDGLGAGAVEQLFQGHLLRIHGAVVEPVRVGHAPTGIAHPELVEMGVGPAHGCLDDLMQPVEPYLQRHLDMAHRHWLDVVQDDPEASNQGHAAILCRVGDQFQGRRSGTRDAVVPGNRARISASQA